MLNQRDRTLSQLYSTVSLLCMKALCSEKPLMFERYVLDVLMNQLLLCCCVKQQGPTFYREVPLLPQKLASKSQNDSIIVSEDEFSKCINNLHKCFVSDMSTLPSDHLFSVAFVLFHLHLKIRQSACHLKTKVEELLVKFLSGCNQKQLHTVFNTFLFGDESEGMLKMNNVVEYTFGSSGGIEVTLKKEPGCKEVFSEEAGDSLIDLLDNGDKKGDVTNSLFVFLLRLMSDPKSDLGRTERNMIAVKMLAILAENPSVHEKLTEDPTHVIFFLQYFLERDANILTKKDSEHCLEEHDTESLFMILMVLSVVVNNASTKQINWEPFKRLVEPLRVIHDNIMNDEMKMFTDEVCNKIISHGIVHRSLTQRNNTNTAQNSSTNKSKTERHAKSSSTSDLPSNKRKEEGAYVKGNVSGKNQPKSDTKKESRCKQALFDVCDPLLPVRGHALLELAKLISSCDKEAQRHRNQILRIFQVNTPYNSIFHIPTCLNLILYKIIPFQ